MKDFWVTVDKGMSQEDAKMITRDITRNKKIWIDFIMSEELGILSDDVDHVKHALVTFTAFVIVGGFSLSCLSVSAIFKFINKIHSKKFSMDLKLSILSRYS